MAAVDPVMASDVSSLATAPLVTFLLQTLVNDASLVDLFTGIKKEASHSITGVPPLEKYMNLIEHGFAKKVKNKTVTIVGAGCSGLCAGYELRKAGFDVQILEASSRVGGRVITFRDPTFAPGLHAEGGAMRIPADHFLLHEYINKFKIPLFDFEMKNKFIYLSGLPKGKRTMTYDEFDEALKHPDQNPGIRDLFPNLKPSERGKTCDKLFTEAVQPVVDHWKKVYKENLPPGATIQKDSKGSVIPDAAALLKTYDAITTSWDKYSLRSYLTDVAEWSYDAINLYDLGNAHVVFENGFIESFKDAFLSSNEGGAKAGMQQPQGGMDLIPRGFLKPIRFEPDGPEESLVNNITFGARVKRIGTEKRGVGFGMGKVHVWYDGPSDEEVKVESDYLVLAIPYTAQRSIMKDRAFDVKQEMAIRDVRYVEVTKVLLQYKKCWWKEQFERKDQGTDGGAVSDLPIRYTMFPKEKGNDQFKNGNPRGAVMAAYTFQQDATILGSLDNFRRIELAARNLDAMYPEANSLKELEASASQVFPADELAGGSAFCYFGPTQKKEYLSTMMKSDWDKRVFFAGEQASYTHGWIQGALEAALRCVGQVYEAATNPIM